jgi:hypothetical protein
MTEHLKFICPAGHPLEASSDESGRVIKCPKCGQPTLVPGDPKPSVKTSSPESEVPCNLASTEEQSQTSVEDSASKDIGLPRIETTSRSSSSKSKSAEKSPLKINASSWEEDELVSPDDPLRRCLPPTDLMRNAQHLTPALLGLILVAFGPAALHIPWIEAPNWSRAAPIIALLEIAYVFWMSITPDYSTLRATAVMFFVGAVLSSILAISLIVYPSDAIVPFGLNGVRSSATAWCFVAALLHFLGGYLSFQLGRKWRSNIEKRWERSAK